MTIKVKCPTRVDLAGGTLDLWPIYSFLDECCTINAAISIYTSAELTKLNSPEIEIEIENIQFKKRFKNLESFLRDSSSKTDFVRPFINFFKPSYGFKLKTSSESPIGGGLGGSSSLAVSVITAFLEMDGNRMSTLDVVNLAHNIEAQILKTPTGTQDYIPPLEGGINLIKYALDKIHIERLSIPKTVFEEHFLLVYTGKPHHSGLNNWQVLKKTVDGDKKTLKCLKGLKDVSVNLLKQIQEQNWDFTQVFKAEYKWRSLISKSFSSPEIRRLEKLALKNGAHAIKICGAGGGGSVIVWCKPSHREKVINACQKEGFQILKANIVDHGVVVKRF